MIYIGIDPDVKKNGVAVWDSKEKSLELYNLSFWELIEKLKWYTVPITVVIEAGWLIKKSNWHGKPNQSKTAGERISKNVGANHQVGKLLAEYCMANKISFTLVKPKGKVNSEYFKRLTGYKKQTNQETRDAGMLVYGK